MADPYIDYVKLLLHCDGANGGTVFTDSMGLNTVTAVGGAVTSTAQGKFGGCSLYLDGDTYSYLSLPNSLFQFNSAEAFTIEAWVRPASIPSGPGTFHLVSRRVGASGFYLFFSVSQTTFQANWFSWGSPVDAFAPLSGTPIPTTTDWVHIALVCESVINGRGTYKLYTNGVGSGAATFTVPATNSSPFVVGKDAGALGVTLPAYIDELRVTAGVARYTTDFTPDETAFDNPPPLTSQGFLPLLGRQNNEVPNALLPTAQAYNRAAVLGWRNIYQGGAGRVSGTVKYTPNSPVHRKVRLIEQATGLVVRETWSDPATGAYSFDYVDATCKYTVLSYDYTGAYRAVVADGIIPEVIT